MPSVLQKLSARHRIDSYILVMFLAAAAGILLFLKLGSEILEGDSFAIDRYLLQCLRRSSDSAIPIGPAWLRSAMVDISALGGINLLTLITLLASGYLLAARKQVTALFLPISIAAGAAMSALFKIEYARPRPDIVKHLVEVSSASFPSGHAMNSAIVYLTVGALLARAEQAPRVRIYIISVAICLTLAIGSSRIYLGVHWPSDVVAGWCVGASWAAMALLIAHRLPGARAGVGPESLSGSSVYLSNRDHES
ncbi:MULTISPECIES: phosphatase PAP2 family protein [Sphingobium]|jgi:undecaprenyl-diphosphatase|uniref:Acid phosphatase n=2 Tax=Sphingobium TaxID=165695 RepID=A0A085K4M3_SPHYA|nr:MULTISPECIES: phosphatase PAP2 family protein [Sphingobium]KEZ13039.1 PAP2 superfamily protein [Sphingobium yanoikuyae]KFD27669.1 acid phosphatase [Sphingobium yanoikuyae]KZC75397.1 acid phosphatase [Sphingobium yanoikuyae]MDG2513897.1 phosphatase PAP2 family protein [Sphingobium yanoikuyae]MDV3481532.1 phosphatase PAP2 family protein [Sphingobium yanoikuyae]